MLLQMRFAQQRSHTKIDQIDRACVFHQIVSGSRRHQQRRQAESGGESVRQAAAPDAERGDNACPLALPHASRDDVKHIRPRRQIQRQRGSHKHYQTCRIGHRQSFSRFQGLCKVLAEIYFSVSQCLQTECKKRSKEGKKEQRGQKGLFLPSLLLFALFASSSTPRNRSIELSRKSRRQRLYKSPAHVSQEYQKER